MTWNACIKKKLAKQVIPDTDLIRSLLKSSRNKFKSSQLLPYSNDTNTSKISLAYDAAREYLEGYAITRSFKIYNHECYTHFLREKEEKSELADIFDRLRKVRNGINYYGEELTEQETKAIIKDIAKFIQSLKKINS